jgi:hypothetical protein
MISLCLKAWVCLPSSWINDQSRRFFSFEDTLNSFDVFQLFSGIFSGMSTSIEVYFGQENDNWIHNNSNFYYVSGSCWVWERKRLKKFPLTFWAPTRKTEPATTVLKCSKIPWKQTHKKFLAFRCQHLNEITTQGQKSWVLDTGGKLWGDRVLKWDWELDARWRL